MYVTYNIATGSISGWSNKSRTPASGYAEVQSDDYIDYLHWYYNPTTDTFSGPTQAEQNEQSAINARNTRNELLQQTDWRFRSDLTPSQAWVDYCQALRDIPSQEGFPTNITWPTPPE